MTANQNTIVTETWKAIDGYNGLYEVSNCGRVRSLDRVVHHPRYHNKRIRGQSMKLRTDIHGYLYVGLSSDGAQKMLKVHRLVLIAFVGEPAKNAVCMHLDNDPKNNRVNNLRWGTISENNGQCREDGRTNVPRGEGHCLAKLTAAQVLRIRALYAAGNVSQRKLAMQFDVARTSIVAIIKRKSWKHI